MLNKVKEAVLKELKDYNDSLNREYEIKTNPDLDRERL